MADKEEGAKKKFVKSVNLMLKNVRAKTVRLITPDFEMDQAGKFSLQAVLTPSSAEQVNDVAVPMSEEAEVPYHPMSAGEALKVSMKASSVDKKTGKRSEYTPMVFLRDNKKASKEDIERCGPRTIFNISLKVMPYTMGGNSGIAFVMNAVQIVDFEGPEPEAGDFGFASYDEAQTDGAPSEY